MKPLTLGLFALAAAALSSRPSRASARVEKGPTRMRPVNTPSSEILPLLRAAALAHDVALPVVLAFADVESRFNPDAEGDAQWPFKVAHGQSLTNWQRHVRDNPHFRDNPWREDPARWISYGLFQLLSPFHARANEDPRALLDPTTNADRGASFIATLLRRANGDAEAARLGYVGCGLDGAHCDAATVAQVRAKFRSALARYEGSDAA